MATMNGNEMLPEVGKLNRIIRTTTQKTASQAIGLDQRPRLHTRSFSQSWVVAPRKMHDPVRRVQEDRADRGDDDDRDALADEERGHREQPRDDNHADEGVRRGPIAMRDLLEPAGAGTPSSRLKANSIRPAEAIEERPQNHIAIAMAADSRRRPCRPGCR